MPIKAAPDVDECQQGNSFSDSRPPACCRV